MSTKQIFDVLDFGTRTLKDGVYFAKSNEYEFLTVGIRMQGNGVNGYSNRSFLKFNLSLLPAKIIITSATLKIYCSYTNYENPPTQGYTNFELHKITSDWSYATLETEPGFQATPLKTIIGPLDKDAVYDFDITNIVKNIYAGLEPNNGFIFKHQIDTWSATAKSVIDFLSPIYTEDVTKRPYIEVTYIETVPQAPTPIEPIGVYKDSGSIIRFSWEVSGIQNKFNLFWSNNNGATWNKTSQTTTNNYYDMPAGTLPTGNISWKVTIYNDYDEESPDSAVNIFTATGVPQTPIITDISNTNTPKPTITWTSTSQQIYQIQIINGSNVVYDTGDIPSVSVKSHTVAKFLEDGDYIVKVRVKNEFDLYSAWGVASFSINTPKPEEPPIMLVNSKYSINAISDLADNRYLLLYRTNVKSSDFKCIAKSSNNILMDYTVESNKQYKYFVRAVSKIGTYFDSDIKTITSSKLDSSVFAPVTDLSSIFEVKHNLSERPVKSVTISTPNTTNYFAGREYPVVEYSEHLSSGISLTFFIQDELEYHQLLDIFYLKGIVLYRDGRRKFYGNISGLNITDYFAGHTVNLSINQTDFIEYLEV